MTPLELRASISLASIYGLRMLGMFLILPIFSLYAHNLPEQPSQLQIGLALGAYGLTQALFQLPFGMASDRFGRKRVIYLGLLIFIIGSLVAAFASNITWIIIGRAIQGAGAVSAAVTALLADLTREEHRTKAMAMVGGTIGITFAASLVLGPALNQWIGIPGIFMLTAALTLLAIGVVKWIVPNPLVSRFHSDAEASSGKLQEVLQNKQLLRLNYGIFALHAAQMAMFVVVPFSIQQTSQMNENAHWIIYLPILLMSFLFMVPAIIYGEKKAKLKPVFLFAIALMFLAQLCFAWLHALFAGVVISLCAYFIAFNILEATLPSIITKLAPAAAKGTAMGVYNTCQSLGVFVGGLVGGYLSHHSGFTSVFAFCALLMLLWLILAASMQTPPAVRSRMLHLKEMHAEQAVWLTRRLAAMEGIREAVVLPEEGTVMLKVDMHASLDEEALELLLNQVHSGETDPVS